MTFAGQATVNLMMSRSIARKAFVLSLLTLISGATSGHARLDGLVFIARAEHFGVTYVSEPTKPALDVFFVSEPIQIALEIGNRSAIEQPLATQGLPLSAAFQIRSIESPSSSLSPGLTIGPDAKAIVFGSEVRVPWGQQLQMSPKSTIVWTATLNAPGPTGVYQFNVVPTFTGSTSPIRIHGSIIRYELRPLNSLADRAELAYRNISRAHASGDDGEVEAATHRLLAIDPTSSHAYQILGQLRESAGRRTEAAAAFSRASALVESGEDRLFLARASREDVRERVAWLRRLLARVQ
jgi:hypothetical protein